MKLKRFLSTLLVCIIVFSITACSKNNDVKESTDNKNTETQSVKADLTEEFPIVIKHAFGETKIESKPERIATIAWANQDTPLALGIVPVGFSKSNFGPLDSFGMLPWTTKKVNELGVESPNTFNDGDGLDYEAINDSKPDVILAAYSGLTQEEYNLLSEIAPVVAYPREAWQTPWREQIQINSTAMGMKAEGEEYIAETEALISKNTSEHPQLKDKTGAFLWINASDLSKFYLYFTKDTRAAYLEDLGIAFPEELNNYKTDDTSFAATISAENIDILNNLDIIVAYGDDNLLEQLQADPLFGTVPAIKRGSVVLIDANSDLAGAATPSALSIPSVIEEYVELLANAADKVN